MAPNSGSFRPNFLQKLANAFAAFSGIPFFLVFLLLPFSESYPRLEENFETIALSLMMITLVLILTWAIIWHIKDIRGLRRLTLVSNDKYWYFGQLSATWFLAVILFFYAGAKLTGQQLSASNLWYGSELGRMNGFMLAWSFFGYSKVYSAFISLGQIAGALALLFRRTTRLGIVILLPILINIFVIDFTYDGLEDARQIIAVLLYILIFLLFCDFKAFLIFFWDHSSLETANLASPAIFNAKKKAILKIIAFVIVLAYPIVLNYYSPAVQGYRSPIDGVWYSRSEKQYDDSLRQFKVLDNNLEFFAEGKYCNIKESGKNNGYNMNIHSAGIEILTRTSKAGAPKTKNIKGNFFLITNDSLEIRGRRGTDSIFWTFKRRNG